MDTFTTIQSDLDPEKYFFGHPTCDTWGCYPDHPDTSVLVAIHWASGTKYTEYPVDTTNPQNVIDVMKQALADFYWYVEEYDTYQLQDEIVSAFLDYDNCQYSPAYTAWNPTNTSRNLELIARAACTKNIRIKPSFDTLAA